MKCNERREGMRKQKIIMSSMVHIVCISEGKYYDFDLDVDEPLTPEIMHKIRPMLREAVDSDDITVLTWQRYEMSL